MLRTLTDEQKWELKIHPAPPRSWVPIIAQLMRPQPSFVGRPPTLPIDLQFRIQWEGCQGSYSRTTWRADRGNGQYNMSCTSSGQPRPGEKYDLETVSLRVRKVKTSHKGLPSSH